MMEQANNIILKEEDRIITNKKEIAELFNEHFVSMADNVPLREEEDYGEDFANHPEYQSNL